jgi:NAD(P) transhydrogenase
MTVKQQFDIVVIGSGPAGQKSAIQAAKGGRSVAIIERERQIGGACVYTGTIPSKTLRENAIQLARLKSHMDAIDVALHEHVQISTLMGNLEEVLDAHDHYIDQQMKRNDITRIHGRARFLDDKNLEITHLKAGKSTVSADYFVIATGSSPRDPTDIDVDHEHILDSDSILSMLYLPKSLVVLGGGVIAAEYASTFTQLGVKVTMIDRYPTPLGFLDADLLEIFCSEFERAGGEFIGGSQLDSVQWDGMSQVVTRLDDGREIKSDKLLFALGRVANVEFLQLSNAGISLTERALVPVNEHCQTCVPHIYAVGDVIGPPSLASASMEQGRRASCHILNIEPGTSAELIPAGIYTIPEMSTIGLTKSQAVEKFGGAIVGKADFSEVTRGHINRIQQGLLKLVAAPDGRKLLGVQIVGEGATELIHIGQMGLLANANIDIFIENIFNFPTLAEAYRVAALQIALQRKHLHA